MEKWESTMKNEILVNISNVSIILTLVYVPAHYSHINIRFLFITTHNAPVLYQIKSKKLT